jgi:Sulfotransferase domain
VTRHLVVIGAQRSGTTYLTSLLEQHPDIAMARPSRPEPKVFLSDEATRRGRDWYVATYFSHADGEQILGEKSTSYIEDAEAPARVAAVLGDPYVLVMVRDPVGRAVSNWSFSCDNGLEQRPLEVALRENLEGPTTWHPGGTSVSPFAYLERGRFADYLLAWQEQFAGSLRVLLLDDLVADHATATAGLYRWLGVDSGFRPADCDQPVNASTVRDATVSGSLERSLRDYFEDADQRLAELIGRPLPWRAADA